MVGLARSEEAASRLSAKEITPFHGDLNSPASLARAAAESDAVIHTGTTNDGNLDQAAVRAMLGALLDSGKPLIYTSGIWVLGDTGGKIADETWPLNPAALVAWRPAAEQMVLASAPTGVRSIVIRPGVVYGRGGGIPADFVKSARETGAARYVGTGENRWPMVHVDDLAELYVLALQRAPSGTIFHATDGSSFRVREIAEAASLGAGGGGRIRILAARRGSQNAGPLCRRVGPGSARHVRKCQEHAFLAALDDSVIEELRRHGSVTEPRP